VADNQVQVSSVVRRKRKKLVKIRPLYKPKPKVVIPPHEEAFECFDKYAHNVKLLQPEEELLVLQKAAQGDTAAKEQLVLANLRLVICIAKKYTGMGLPLMDLIQEGNIGLIRSVEKYIPGKSKFCSYAGLRIRATILRALSNQSRIIRMGAHHFGRLFRLRREELVLLARLEREPTVKELSAATGFSVDAIRKLEGCNYVNQSMVQLDKTVSVDGEQGSLYETLVDPNAADPASAAEKTTLGLLLDAILGELTAKDQQLIQMKFGLAGFTLHSLQEIGDAFELSKQRIGIIQKKALRQIKGKLTEALLQSNELELLRSYAKV